VLVVPTGLATPIIGGLYCMEARILDKQANYGVAGIPRVMRILVELRDVEWREHASFQVVETWPELMIDVLARKIRRHLSTLGRPEAFEWAVDGSALDEGEVEPET
jgi:hypothetical protein